MGPEMGFRNVAFLLPEHLFYTFLKCCCRGYGLGAVTYVVEVKALGPSLML